MISGTLAQDRKALNSAELHKYGYTNNANASPTGAKNAKNKNNIVGKGMFNMHKVELVRAETGGAEGDGVDHRLDGRDRKPHTLVAGVAVCVMVFIGLLIFVLYLDLVDPQNLTRGNQEGGQKKKRQRRQHGSGKGGKEDA